LRGMSLMRLCGETFEEYKQRTGLDHYATEAEMRAYNQEYIRDYARAHNPPRVVEQMERDWATNDRTNRS
jgi:hypothetical protein